MSETQIWHGGDLDEARKLFPRAPEPWIDLSTGINPIPYPMPALLPSLFERLPSPEEHRDLEKAAAEAYGARDPAMVVAAPGTQILIGLLPLLRPHSHVAIISPTYAEHALTWRQSGHEVVEVVSEQIPDSDVMVIVNPNNPDGRIHSRQMLVELAARQHRRGGWLVVDEAFADFDSGETIVPCVPKGAIVLRSFGKTYGLAGIRLGFAIAEPDISNLLRKALGPWAVAGPAIAVGRNALRDKSWRDAAGRARAADASRLGELLRQAIGADTVGTSLYRLAESPAAGSLFSHLGRFGIWTRRFRENPNRLRLGLPGSDQAWARLERAIAEFSCQDRKPLHGAGSR
ncbi:threonine-phosphate decarboxylase CobD [Microvirga flavescens]|uniref:threonine-phosphate decarboxylase CobD n=1 Tax=Microvirga flavescens TaxID=2249811 RepID=UPI000DD9900D|nr:threonine-phosphate decarboxylase CobD [Microvirga flavescens]